MRSRAGPSHGPTEACRRKCRLQAMQRVSGSQGGRGSAPEEEVKAERSKGAASQPPGPCRRGRDKDA